MDNATRIADILKDMGIRPDLRGYEFLYRAVEMCLSDGDKVHRMTKDLYPDIAKMFHTTSSRVERNIRHAVEVGWITGNMTIQQRVFRNTVDPDKGKPTNGHFIATVVDQLRRSEPVLDFGGR